MYKPTTFLRPTPSAVIRDRVGFSIHRHHSKAEILGSFIKMSKFMSVAEEQVLYPPLSPYYDQMQEIVDQTDEVIVMLDEVKSFNPADPNFKTQVEQLRLAVRGHIDQEEKDIFPQN